MPLLEVEGLTVRFGGLTAVADLSFSVQEGAIHALIGPNGAGKTTVFNCLSRFYQSAAGAIRFAGQDLLRSGPHEVVSLGITRTFQNVELFKSLTVIENCLVGQHSSLSFGFLAGGLRLPGARRAEEAARARAREVLELLGIGQMAERPAVGLPFGTMKRVELARALVSKPRLLLLDEPAAGLNPTETEELAQLIRRIACEDGITVLLVEHDMSLVMGICQRISVLDFGKKIAEGTADQVRDDPAVIEAYLGEAATLAQA